MMLIRPLVIAPLALASLTLASCTRYHEQPLTADAVEHALAVPDDDALRVATASIHHPLLAPLAVDLAHPLTPDQVALVAVALNPSLRAARDQRALGEAQVIQAGLLPNPEFSFSADHAIGGVTEDTVDAFGLGLTWEVTALIGRGARIDAAQAQAQAVMLDVAWQEWQIAEGAKAAAYRILALQEQVIEAERADRLQQAQRDHLHQAIAAGEALGGDLAAVSKDAQEAHTTLLEARQDVLRQRLTLNRFLGLPPGKTVTLSAFALPDHLSVPTAAALEPGLENRRLDLLALRRGYDSQEAALRAAVLAQFPKLSLGVQHARDNSNLVTAGFGISLELPIFDRHQGEIASETATRQKLFDEYASRLFEARSDIALALADLSSTGEAIADARGALPELEQRDGEFRALSNAGDLDAATAAGATIALAQKRLELTKLAQAWAEARIALELAAGCTVDSAGVVMSPVPTVKEPTP